MPYYLTKDELYHANIGGWIKQNHKYLERFFKNGKWHYIYKPSQGGGSSPKGNFGAGMQKNTPYHKSNEYYTVNKNGARKTTEYTRNGQQLLSKQWTLVDSDGNKTVYKTKGKIAQSIEKAAKKGFDYIQKRMNKKKKKKSGGTHSYKEGKMDKSITVTHS